MEVEEGYGDEAGWNPPRKVELELERPWPGPGPSHMSRLFSLGYLPVQPQALAMEERNLGDLGPKNIRQGEKELVRGRQGNRGC